MGVGGLTRDAAATAWRARGRGRRDASWRRFIDVWRMLAQRPWLYRARRVLDRRARVPVGRARQGRHLPPGIPGGDRPCRRRRFARSLLAGQDCAGPCAGDRGIVAARTDRSAALHAILSFRRWVPGAHRAFARPRGLSTTCLQELQTSADCVFRQRHGTRVRRLHHHGAGP